MILPIIVFNIRSSLAYRFGFLQRIENNIKKKNRFSVARQKTQ